MRACKRMEGLRCVESIDQQLALGQNEGVALVFGQVMLWIADIASGGTQDEVAPKRGLHKHSFAEFGVRSWENCAGSQRPSALGRPFKQQVPGP